MNFNTEWLAAHSANLLGEITGESFHFVSEGKALYIYIYKYKTLSYIITIIFKQSVNRFMIMSIVT